MEMLSADVMECSEHAAFKQRVHGLDGIGCDDNAISPDTRVFFDDPPYRDASRNRPCACWRSGNRSSGAHLIRHSSIIALRRFGAVTLSITIERTLPPRPRQAGSRGRRSKAGNRGRRGCPSRDRCPNWRAAREPTGTGRRFTSI